MTSFMSMLSEIVQPAKIQKMELRRRFALFVSNTAGNCWKTFQRSIGIVLVRGGNYTPRSRQAVKRGFGGRPSGGLPPSLRLFVERNFL